MPKGTAALNAERSLREQVQQLLSAREKNPEVFRAERTTDSEVVVLYSVDDSEARTAWLTYQGDGQVEIVTCAGFVW